MRIVRVVCIVFGMMVAMGAQGVNDFGQLARIFQESKVGKTGKYPKLTVLRIDRNNKLSVIKILEGNNNFNIEYCDISDFDKTAEEIVAGCSFRVVSNLPMESKIVSAIMHEISKPPAEVTLEGTTYWVTTGGPFWSNTIKFTDAEWNPCLSNKRVVKLFCIERVK